MADEVFHGDIKELRHGLQDLGISDALREVLSRLFNDLLSCFYVDLGLLPLLP